jgi:hypothetical protein
VSEAAGQESEAATVALAELRALRRRRFVADIDVMEVLYRVYVGAIFGAIGLGVLAGAVEEAPVGSSGIEWLRDRGPAALGILVALAVLAGLRSGARGGPLAIEAAEVQYVLLAPLDRGTALRPAALRQMRPAALTGAVLGAIVGNFVFRRLPGSPVEWIAGLALFGALVPLCALGAALLASGRRLRPPAATAIGAVLVAWSVADLALGWVGSPASMIGELGTLPLQGGLRAALVAPGFVLGSALVLAGALAVGGIELEAARRRATLAAELRFSASVQDLRAVILLRRQLASERPRRRPWIRLRRHDRERLPVWRRGWRSFLRWPPARIARVLLIGVAAGAAAAGAWSGTALLLVLPGPLLLVAALDLIEPLAQEADHPTRLEGLPVPPGRLISRQLAAPAAGLAAVLAVATLTAAALGSPATALGLGAVLLVPTACLLAGCAALSATNDPYAHVLVPQIGYLQSGAPVAIAAIAAGVPVLAAREAARNGHSAIPAAAGAAVALLIVAVVVGVFLEGRMGSRAAVRAVRG